MSNTINLDIPRTAEERLAREEASIWGLIKRIEARASDGRFYHLEDDDREQAIAYLKGYAKTHSKVLSDVRGLSTPNQLRAENEAAIVDEAAALTVNARATTETE